MESFNEDLIKGIDFELEIVNKRISELYSYVEEWQNLMEKKNVLLMRKGSIMKE